MKRMVSYVGVDETELRWAMMRKMQCNGLVKHLVKWHLDTHRDKSLFSRVDIIIMIMMMMIMMMMVMMRAAYNCRAVGEFDVCSVLHFQIQYDN